MEMPMINVFSHYFVAIGGHGVQFWPITRSLWMILQTLLLRALSGQHRAQRGAQTQEPGDHDLSWSQTLNRLSHPGVPLLLFYRKEETLSFLFSFHPWMQARHLELQQLSCDHEVTTIKKRPREVERQQPWYCWIMKQRQHLPRSRLLAMGKN